MSEIKEIQIKKFGTGYIASLIIKEGTVFDCVLVKNGLSIHTLKEFMNSVKNKQFDFTDNEIYQIELIYKLARTLDED